MLVPPFNRGQLSDACVPERGEKQGDETVKTVGVLDGMYVWGIEAQTGERADRFAPRQAVPYDRPNHGSV